MARALEGRGLGVNLWKKLPASLNLSFGLPKKRSSVPMSSIVSGAMRRVLLLGSGFTSTPVVEYLTRKGDTTITVASDVMSQAEQLAKTYQNTKAVSLDVHSEEKLDNLVKDHDLVISCIPNFLHPLVAKHCVANRTNMVTTSYVSPAMKEFHKPAVDEGITILNEVGLDPGLDHMLAMQCFDEVHNKGGKIVSFESWCGGLPHPEYSNNPLKYKFSWSPISVFLAAKNSAKFIRDGKLVEITEGNLMHPDNVVKFGAKNSPLPDVDFEGYYNRDSTKYIGIYDIQEAKTVIRGTYRYRGNCKLVNALLKFGLLDDTEHQRLQPGAAELQWKDLMAIMISQTDIRQSDLRSSVSEVVGGDAEIMQVMEELGLLSTEHVQLKGSPLKALCAHMEQLLKYNPGEQDAIYLNHFIGIKWPDNKVETRHINYTKYGTFGTPGSFTAMAQSVGQPAAIASKLILDGKLTKRGVITPTTKDIYQPILEELKKEGIVAKISSINTPDNDRASL